MSSDVFVASLDDRPAIVPVASQVALERSLHLEPERVITAVVLGEERLEVRGEALVEPDVRPVLAGQEIAEPLVGQLVRDQAVVVVLERGDLVVQRGRRSSSWPRCSPCRRPELGYAHLGVLGVRIGLADLLAEETDHRRGLAHEPPGGRLVDVLGHVVVDRQVADPVVIDREIRCGQRDQVADVGDVHLPVVGRGVVRVVLGFDQAPLERTNRGFSTVMIISLVARSLG